MVLRTKESKNSVFIATSLDGFIADSEGGVGWLDIIPNPEQKDLGYFPFMERIDALLMGRNTFQTVLNFGIPWPYTKPVFVWSRKTDIVPEDLSSKVEQVSGNHTEIISKLNAKGFFRIYVDGGQTIQAFLKDDLIDEMIITRIPLLLGGGIPLFGEMSEMLEFKLVKSEVLLGAMVQDFYERKR